MPQVLLPDAPAVALPLPIRVEYTDKKTSHVASGAGIAGGSVVEQVHAVSMNELQGERTRTGVGIVELRDDRERLAPMTITLRLHSARRIHADASNTA